jgi:hypothetical protein
MPRANFGIGRVKLTRGFAGRRVIYTDKTTHGAIDQDSGLTDINFHRSWTELNDSQALVKLNNVIGGFVETPLSAGAFSLVPLTGGGGVAMNEGWTSLLSLLPMIVWSPDGRKMPPPARLSFVVSRARLASWKVLDVGAEDGGEDAKFVIGEEVEEIERRVSVDVREREETGFMRSSSAGRTSGMGGFETIEFAFPFPPDDPVGGSMILMGMRRRFGDTEVDCDSVPVAVAF